MDLNGLNEKDSNNYPIILKYGREKWCFPFYEILQKVIYIEASSLIEVSKVKTYSNPYISKVDFQGVNKDYKKEASRSFHSFRIEDKL